MLLRPFLCGDGGCPAGRGLRRFAGPIRAALEGCPDDGRRAYEGRAADAIENDEKGAKTATGVTGGVTNWGYTGVTTGVTDLGFCVYST